MEKNRSFWINGNELLGYKEGAPVTTYRFAIGGSVQII